MAFGTFHDTFFYDWRILDEIIFLLEFLTDLVEIGVIPSDFFFLYLFHDLVQIVCEQIFDDNLIQQIL